MRRKTRLGLFALGALAGYFLCRKRWSVAHNLIAHPLEVFFEDSERLNRFHDYTARKWAGR